MSEAGAPIWAAFSPLPLLGDARSVELAGRFDSEDNFRPANGLTVCGGLVRFKEPDYKKFPHFKGGNHLALCDHGALADRFWREHVPQVHYFDPSVEWCVVLHLNTRRRVTSYHLVASGTQDTLLLTPRAVFRGAVIAGANAVILMHNHPSGDPSPSAADAHVTSIMRRAGETLFIEVLDHVIVGERCYTSLRDLGYFYGEETKQVSKRN